MASFSALEVAGRLRSSARRGEGESSRAPGGPSNGLPPVRSGKPYPVARACFRVMRGSARGSARPGANLPMAVQGIVPMAPWHPCCTAGGHARDPSPPRDIAGGP